MFLVPVVISLAQLEDPTQSKTFFSRLMRTPKIFSLFLPRKHFPFVSALQFFFYVLNGCIIYVNLNNKVRITKQSPFWEKFGVSHETVQQNTSVTMPAAGGKNFQVPPQGFRFPPKFLLPPKPPPGKNNASPPPQGLPVSVFENSYQRPNWGEPYVKIPGTGFQNVFTTEFGHFLVTIFF